MCLVFFSFCLSVASLLLFSGLQKEIILDFYFNVCLQNKNYFQGAGWQIEFPQRINP